MGRFISGIVGEWRGRRAASLVPRRAGNRNPSRFIELLDGQGFFLASADPVSYIRNVCVKGIKEGTQVSDNQYTAVFDVWRKIERGIAFRVFFPNIILFLRVLLYGTT
jgi:hypothetical protein